MQQPLSTASFPKISTCLTLATLLLSGCAKVNTNLNESPPPITVQNVQSDFDDFLFFGVNMAKSSPTARTEICRSLQKRQKSSPDDAIQLQIMLGRLLSDTCGEVPKILDGISTIQPEVFSDERMQKMFIIQTEALKRLLPPAAPKKNVTSERKQKTDKSGTEAKEVSGAKKTEADLLREKLEAIRSMEKHLDESGDKH